MSTGRDRRHSTERTSRAFRDGLPGLSRYDVLLALIPLAFATTLLAHLVTPVPLHMAVVAAGLVGVVTVADALFLNPPEPKR